MGHDIDGRSRSARLDNPLDQVADVGGVRDVVLTRQRHLDRRDPLRLEAGLHLVEAGRGALVAVDEQYGPGGCR